jgi:lipid II isoglutaminyl synthase (glutamine-hydrolysing)
VPRDRASVLRIGSVLPDVLGTYGDGGNATVLGKRAEWRGCRAEIVEITLGTAVPTSLDIYLLGGGENAAQTLAASELIASGAIGKAVERGAVVFGVCAGLQVLGECFATAERQDRAGLGLLDVRTIAGKRRAIGEVLVDPDRRLLTRRLTGFENHLGRSTLGAGSQPLGTVRRGTGNGDEQDGAYTGKVVGTYLHGPVFARNPELADRLLSWAVGAELAPLPLHEVDSLRDERLVRGARWRTRLRVA